MDKYKLIALFATLLSLIGTVLGAFLGTIIKKPKESFLTSSICFSAGVMLAVVCFDLIPASIEEIGVKDTFIFLFLGILCIILINIIYKDKNKYNNKYQEMAFLIGIGLAIHNLPEGLVMGCSYSMKNSLGLKMSITMAIHDIPEGLAIAAPLSAYEESSAKIILYSFLTSIPTLIGVIAGIAIGFVSKKFLGIAISMAAGIMIYISIFKMIVESLKMHKVFNGIVGTIIGVILGVIITFL